MSDTKDLCPCGSGKNYCDCCEPIIKGSAKAPTAEALMRSRYSAYVKHEIDHIAKSCVQDPDRNEIDLEETRRWSEESTWHGLKILRTEKGKESDSFPFSVRRIFKPCQVDSSLHRRVSSKSISFRSGS